MMKIGILGYGTVGKGVVKIIEESFPNIKIEHICVKDTTDCLDERFTTDTSVLLNNIDVLLEMIVGESPAYEIICDALSRGVHVITSNKATVATHLEEFAELAIKNQVQFRFEASVGGGIPWIESCIKAKRIDSIRSVKGILNGTTNYILDRMQKERIDFDECLQDAQRLGYAEQDPSADIDGYDVQRKIMISSSLAYGGIIPYTQFDCVSLRHIKRIDLIHFEEEGYTIKYIGSSFIHDHQVYGSVEPVLIKKNDLFAQVDKNNNVVELIGDTIGSLKFVGQGAGQLPTANAMIQDLLDILDSRKNELHFNHQLQMNLELCKNTYIFCSNQNIFDNTKMDVIQLNHRVIAISSPMTPKQRNEYLEELRRIDDSVFCIRKEEA